MTERKGGGSRAGLGVLYVILSASALTTVLPFFWMINTLLKALPAAVSTRCS